MLGFIPILFCWLGKSNGKSALKVLPLEQSMLARSGYRLSIWALIINLVIFAFILVVTFANQYTLYKFFSFMR